MDGSLLAVALRGLFPTAAPDHSAAWRPQRAPSRLWLLMLIGVRRIGRLAARRPAAATPIAPPPPHPTSLTGPVTAARSVAAMTVSLDGVQQARRRTGGTLNDHFLAIVTDALRVYLQAIPETVLALVPRNVRTEAEAEAVGNRAWSILVPLPTGEPDASKRMASIAAATEAGKQAPRTLGTQGWRFDIALTNVRLGGPFALCGRPVVRSRSSVPTPASKMCREVVRGGL